MNTGSPRQNVRDTALQLLQLLDKRFFGTVGPLQENDLGNTFFRGLLAGNILKF